MIEILDSRPVRTDENPSAALRFALLCLAELRLAPLR